LKDFVVLVSMSPEYLLYYFPLLVGVSLVLAATKHEDSKLILRQALSTGFWFSVFMLAVAAILSAMMWFI
jgi:hypothetical protein